MSTPVPEAYEDEVVYGSRRVPFRVVPTARSTLGISVYPDGRVEVRAPLDADIEAVRSRVQRRARWITRQQRHFADFVRPIPEKDYVAGETHRYLGGQYRLKIFSADTAGEGVKLIGRYFEVRTARPDDPERTRQLLDQWYAQSAQRHLRRRFEEGVATMRRYGVGDPELLVRAMKRRWGSCTPTSMPASSSIRSGERCSTCCAVGRPD